MRRSISTLLLPLLIAACGEVVPTAGDPPVAASLHAGPAGGYPVVVVQPRTGGAGGGAVTANLAEALTAVATGGTILVHPGTYAGPLPPVDRAMTIRGVGPEAPVVDGSADCWALRVAGPEGPVAIEGLRFVPGFCGGLLVEGEHGPVAVEASEFEGPNGGVTIHGGASDARVTVRDNDFVGHRAQARTSFAPQDVVIEGNRFSGPNTAIHLGPGTSGRVEANALTGCGGEPGCIAVGSLFHDPAGGGAVDILDNLIEVEISEQLPSGMLVGTGDHRILGNVVRGIGQDAAAANPWERYPLTLAGIEVVDGARAEVSGNTVENAFIGLQFGAPVTASGLDNVVTGVEVGIQAFPDAVVTIRSSDLTDWTFALQAGGPQDFTCNWWGDAAGPGPTGGDPTLYTPWATTPVAGTSTTTCSGGP